MRNQMKKQHLIILYLFHNYIQGNGTMLKWSEINEKCETTVIKRIECCLYSRHVIRLLLRWVFEFIPRFGFQTVL